MFRERSPQRGDVDAVGPDCLVQQLGRDLELFRPVGDVGCDLGLDLVGVHGDLVVVLGLGVLDDFGGGKDRFRLGGGVGVGRVGRILVRHGGPLFRFLRGLMHGMAAPLRTSPSFDVKS